MRLFLLLLLAASCHAVLAEEFNARVIAVMDGDTVMVLHGDDKIRVRLSNIDAPEKAQKFGTESRQALVRRVLQKIVHVNSQALDNYGRLVAEISVAGHSVNEEQVRNGMAWEYSHFHRNAHYLALQGEAQRAHRGLWAQAGKPMPPEQWRKLHPATDYGAHTGNMPSAATREDGCGNKRRCAQMQSCEEAYFYLQHCGVKSLDGNGDGVPCDGLCEAERHRLH